MKAVIPAAGLGTRFLPYTKAQAKEMLPIVDKPAIQYVVEEAVEAGIREAILITGRSKRSIEDHFDPDLGSIQGRRHSQALDRLRDLNNLLRKVSFSYVRQSTPRGLGDAVLR